MGKYVSVAFDLDGVPLESKPPNVRTGAAILPELDQTSTDKRSGHVF